MWIRSQNKLRLVNSSAININDILYKTLGVCFIDVVIEHNYVMKIAEYTTKEKALKVLDMMEKHLSAKIVEFDLNGKITREVCKADYVFQMPQDNEVMV